MEEYPVVYSDDYNIFEDVTPYIEWCMALLHTDDIYWCAMLKDKYWDEYIKSQKGKVHNYTLIYDDTTQVRLLTEYNDLEIDDILFHPECYLDI